MNKVLIVVKKNYNKCFGFTIDFYRFVIYPLLELVNIILFENLNLKS